MVGKVSVKVTSRMDVPKVIRQRQRQNITGLRHMGAYTRKTTINTIKKSPKPSTPGTPIHTRAGLAKVALLFAHDKARQVTLVGFRYSVIGQAVAAHEHGRLYRGIRYPKRPVILPGMTKSLAKLSSVFVGQTR